MSCAAMTSSCLQIRQSTDRDILPTSRPEVKPIVAAIWVFLSGVWYNWIAARACGPEWEPRAGRFACALEFALRGWAGTILSRRAGRRRDSRESPARTPTDPNKSPEYLAQSQADQTSSWSPCGPIPLSSPTRRRASNEDEAPRVPMTLVPFQTRFLTTKTAFLPLETLRIPHPRAPFGKSSPHFSI